MSGTVKKAALEEVYSRWTADELGTDGVEAISQGRLQTMEFCKEQGLSCFDATFALTAQAETGRAVYWPDDTHLNELGNQVLADVVWKFLADRLYISE